MDPEKITERKLPSGVEKRTLKGLYGRVKQVESRVEAAYKGLNDAVDGKMAGILSLHMEAVAKQISALQSEIATLRNKLNAEFNVVSALPDTAEPSAVENPA